MPFKVNVKPLAGKNPIGILCAATTWQKTVGIVREKECFAEKMEQEDDLPRP